MTIQRWLNRYLSNTHVRELFQGAAIAMVFRVGALVGSFTFSLLLARKLGAEQSGLFFLGMTTVLVATVVSGLGLDNAVMRYVSEAHADENGARTDSIWRQSTLTTLAVSVILATILFFSRSVIARIFGEPGLEAVLFWFAPCIVPSALLLVNSSALKGIKRIAAATATGSFVMWMFAIPLMYWLVTKNGLTGAIQAYLIANVIALSLSWTAWRKHVKSRGTVSESGYTIMMRTALPLLWVSVMGLVIRWSDTLMIGYMLDSADVGLYNIAFRISNLINFFLVAISAVATPKFAAMWYQGERTELERLVRIASLFVAAAAAPFFLVAWIWPQVLLGFFGAEFKEAASAMRILLVGHYLSCAMGPVGSVLMMTGLEKSMRTIISVMAVYNIGMNLLLIPLFGISGAAIASASGLILVSLVYVIVIARNRNIHILPKKLTAAVVRSSDDADDV